MPSWHRLAMRVFLLSCLMGVFAREASAIILYGGTLGRNLDTPSGAIQDSGAQYEGSWSVGVGTPISPHYFLTAAHLGGNPNGGDTFVLHGVNYTTVGFTDDPNGSDLRLVQVAQAFTSYAPLYLGGDEFSAKKTAVVFGRGTARGDVVNGPNGPAGYLWGAQDGLMSYGVSQISFDTIFNNGDGTGSGPRGQFIGGDFSTRPNPLGGPSMTFSAGDSGGGVFIKDVDGIWKLAAVNYAVDGPFSYTQNGTYFNAAIYDARGFYVGSSVNNIFIPNGTDQVNASWFSTRVFDKAGFIQTVTGVPEPTSIGLMALGSCGLGFLLRKRGRNRVC